MQIKWRMITIKDLDYKKLWHALKEELEGYSESWEVCYSFAGDRFDLGMAQAYRTVVADMKLYEEGQLKPFEENEANENEKSD